MENTAPHYRLVIWVTVAAVISLGLIVRSVMLLYGNNSRDKQHDDHEKSQTKQHRHERLVHAFEDEARNGRTSVAHSMEIGLIMWSPPSVLMSRELSTVAANIMYHLLESCASPWRFRYLVHVCYNCSDTPLATSPHAYIHKQDYGNSCRLYEYVEEYCQRYKRMDLLTKFSCAHAPAQMEDEKGFDSTFGRFYALKETLGYMRSSTAQSPPLVVCIPSSVVMMRRWDSIVCAQWIRCFQRFREEYEANENKQTNRFVQPLLTGSIAHWRHASKSLQDQIGLLDAVHDAQQDVFDAHRHVNGSENGFNSTPRKDNPAVSSHLKELYSDILNDDKLGAFASTLECGLKLPSLYSVIRIYSKDDFANARLLLPLVALAHHNDTFTFPQDQNIHNALEDIVPTPISTAWWGEDFLAGDCEYMEYVFTQLVQQEESISHSRPKLQLKDMDNDEMAVTAAETIPISCMIHALGARLYIPHLSPAVRIGSYSIVLKDVDEKWCTNALPTLVYDTEGPVKHSPAQSLYKFINYLTGLLRLIGDDARRAFSQDAHIDWDANKTTFSIGDDAILGLKRIPHLSNEKFGEVDVLSRFGTWARFASESSSHRPR